ncbi:MAG: NAD(P)H-dependent oxidoreductase subunit E, partial [Phycisphaeraceae bacterium]
MAWIVKDSAHQKVDRRAEPYVSEAMKAKWEADLLPRYATRQAALLPICHDVQHEHGWLPAQALEEIADFVGINVAEVLDTVTFYEEYHLKPKGRHLVQICRSIACELCGYRDLSEKVQQKLGILPGETTEDGRITLMELECLGACDLAPCGLINETLQEKISWADLEKQIDAL